MRAGDATAYNAQQAHRMPCPASGMAQPMRSPQRAVNAEAAPSPPIKVLPGRRGMRVTAVAAHF